MENCSLCLNMTKLQTLDCGHIFCSICIFEKCQCAAKCPLCDHRIHFNAILHNTLAKGGNIVRFDGRKYCIYTDEITLDCGEIVQIVERITLLEQALIL